MTSVLACSDAIAQPAEQVPDLVKPQSPALSILRSSQVAPARRLPDQELITLDLHYEAIIGSTLSPHISDCVAQRMGSRWLLPSSANDGLSEADRLEVQNAFETCKLEQWAGSKPDEKMVQRQVAEAVTRTLSENALARLRLKKAKEEVRGCLKQGPQSDVLRECLKSANADLVEPRLLDRLLAISAQWLN